MLNLYLECNKDSSPPELQDPFCEEICFINKEQKNIPSDKNAHSPSPLIKSYFSQKKNISLFKFS